MSIKDKIKRKLPPTSMAMEQNLKHLLEDMQNQFVALSERISVLENKIISDNQANHDKLRQDFSQLSAQLNSLEQQQNEEIQTFNSYFKNLFDILEADTLKQLRKLEENKKSIVGVVHRRADRLEEIDNRRTPRTELSFEVALAEHCNLRCAGCDHFSPIAEPEFANIDEFKRDFSRLAELFSGQAQEIHLLGGEPLLNPDIVLFLQAARKNFPQAVIYITTNGLLLQQMSEEFWTACRENKIVIQPTKYPIDLDYDALETLAVEHGVEYRYFNNTSSIIKTLNKYPLDLNGLQDARRSFRLCYRANKCIYLQHGKLYTCTVAPTIRHLNKRFGLNLTESLADSIDIYSAKSAQEILEFLANPIPFCKYCMPEKAQWGLPWRQSEKALAEWTL